MPLAIRRADPRDTAVVAEFNRLLASETEGKILDPGVLARGVARLLADPARGFYLVAEADGQVVGQVMATFEWSDWRDGWFWWVQSVYVRDGYRRHGVFRALFTEMVRRARDAGDVIGLRLYVENQNTRAQATYEGLGLRNAGYSVRESLLDALP
ncbi:MAG TPA: GNAT family N-acetyltransferase [Gemmataceae bacterium]|nr:GNAT family N-acetyltransferase [Gemmataceae bacterium]